MIGKRLYQLRKENKLTQKELAKLLGLTDRAISYYETEKRYPAPDILIKIADFFNVSIDWLFGRTNIRSSVNIVADNNLEYKPHFDDNEVISLKELEEFVLNRNKRKL